MGGGRACLKVLFELSIVLVVDVLGRRVQRRAHIAPEMLVAQVSKQLVVAKIVQLAEFTNRVTLQKEWGMCTPIQKDERAGPCHKQTLTLKGVMPASPKRRWRARSFLE